MYALYFDMEKNKEGSGIKKRDIKAVAWGRMCMRRQVWPATAVQKRRQSGMLAIILNCTSDQVE